MDYNLAIKTPNLDLISTLSHPRMETWKMNPSLNVKVIISNMLVVLLILKMSL